MFKLNKSMWMAYNKHVLMHIPVLKIIAKLNVKASNRYPRYTTVSCAYSTLVLMTWAAKLYTKHTQTQELATEQ